MAGRTRAHVGPLLGAVCALGLPAPAAQALPAAVLHCGQVVTQDTTLANDLRDCHGIGIVIGADDVTLDLGGHVVDGDGVADFEGIQSKGFDRVTIRNGSVRDFVEGVAVLFTTGTTISDLAISRQRHVGVFLDGGDHVVVQRTSTRDIAFSGVFVTRSQDVAVRDNTSRDSGGGVGTRASHDLVISGNHVTSSTGTGIGLFDDVQRAQVLGNTVSDGRDAGVLVEADAARVAGNVVARNADNIVVLGNDAVVVDNLVGKARGFRGDPASGFGIVVDGGSNAVIAHNDVSDSAGDGIRIFQFDPDAPGPPTGHVVRANKVVGSRLDGILVGPTVVDVVVEGNTTLVNRDDGIDDESPSSTLARNTASANGDLGIEAVPGVTDGGGNLAAGNGNPLQCVVVLCG